VTGISRRLFALLGQLPAGVVEVEGEVLLHTDWYEATDQLHAVGLLAPGPRYDLLPPVRDFARRYVEPKHEEGETSSKYFAHLLLEVGQKLGWDGGGTAIERLLPELPNVEAALQKIVLGLDLYEFKDLINRYSELLRFSGAGSVTVLEEIAKSRKAAGDLAGAVVAMFLSGLILSDRSDYDAAQLRYAEALPVFQKGNDPEDEANCLRRLGDIAREHRDAKSARNYYEMSLRLFWTLDGKSGLIGQANCTRGIADSYLIEADYPEAKRIFIEALNLHKQYDSALGEAACLKALADIALTQSDLDDALSKYKSS
jgi:tetratricopeptide (TPR) repeat protein